MLYEVITEIYLSPTAPQGSRMRRIDSPNIALEGSDGDIIDSAREFLRAHGHERWFLYLHMMDRNNFV